MRAAHLRGGSLFSGSENGDLEWKRTRARTRTINSFCLCSERASEARNARIHRKRSSGYCAEARVLFRPNVTRLRKPLSSLSPDYGVHFTDVDDTLPVKEKPSISSQREDDLELTWNPTSHPNVKHELVMLSLPAIAGQAIDPLAQLLETAYIGRLGPVDLGSAGVSVTIFNLISKLFNIPLLSVATSFVAEDISKNATKVTASGESIVDDHNNGKPVERMQLPSVSTALLLAIGIGLFEAVALFFGSKILIDLMGITSASPMHAPAQQFLAVRALGAPAVVLYLTLQGIFRGFKDTRTPVLCLGIGNLAAAFMIPLLMYKFQLGVIGAAISTVVSQYIVTFLMLWELNKRAILLPPKMGSLQFGGYIQSGGFVLGRTLAVLATMTVGTSMAARQGPIAMAAHQICMQIWLAVSLLTDSIGTSAQAMIASYFSKGDYKTVKEITHFVLKIGVVTGIFLGAILGLSFDLLAPLFTKDAEVLRIMGTIIMFVSASQPINALAFIYDGLQYGVSDFPYAARSMMVVGAISTAFLLYAPRVIGLYGVWSGLTLFMALRMVAGFIRLLSKTGPWWFMHMEQPKIQVC